MVTRGTHRSPLGFTLIELMIVISILLILISVAIPLYQQSILHAKESALKQDLRTLRDAIDEYTLDQKKAPQTLQDLAGDYLRELPKDPFTNSADTWEVVNEDVQLAVDQTQPGITEVHSGSQKVSSDGTAYNTW